MFRYRDSHGIEKRIGSEMELVNAIRDGRVQASTPLAMGEEGDWGVAGRHPAYARAGRKRLPGPRPATPETRDLLLSLVRSRRVAWSVILLAVLLAGFGVNASVMRKRALAAQRLDYASAMLGIAEGRAPSPELIAHPAPHADDAALRTAWVRMQVAHTIWQSMLPSMSALNISGFLPPTEWMSDAYIADASAFPHVGTHWGAYLAWDRAWSPRANRLLNLENARRAAEAGMTERETFELIDPAQPGLSAVGWDLELRRQFAEEASRLHTTLVESRGNALLDEGKWWFADTRTQRAYVEHTRNLRRIGDELRANAAARAAVYGLAPGDGVVPAGLAGMKPAGE